MLLADALQCQAHAIRLIPSDSPHGRVEYDIASGWQLVAEIPDQPFGALINRLKVMAALDIGRVPVQKGELHIRASGARHILKICVEATRARHERVSITGLSETDH
jgi:type II secretory ATPase GspE/PulE/Tfp pilus assembly ATPase PilB-like protein